MRVTGTVKFFDASKKFGFITVDGGGSAFVCQADLDAFPDRSLVRSERVSFDIKPDRRGQRAQAVRPLWPKTPDAD